VAGTAARGTDAADAHEHRRGRDGRWREADRRHPEARGRRSQEGRRRPQEDDRTQGGNAEDDRSPQDHGTPEDDRAEDDGTPEDDRAEDRRTEDGAPHHAQGRRPEDLGSQDRDAPPQHPQAPLTTHEGGAAARAAPPRI
jgi:hypothetical protein